MKRNISRSELGFVILLIMLGWILDVISTFLGIRLGLSEASPYFMLFPSGWLILMVSLALFVYKFKSAPFWLRGLIMFWMVAFSFIPAARNSALILKVILG